MEKQAWLQKSPTTWQDQLAQATILGSNLTVTLDPGYTSTIDWTTGWRLPATIDGAYDWGNDGTTTAGFNITTSEMGHLYYDELGNLGYRDPSGNTQAGYGLQYIGIFDNLSESFMYWSGTEYTPTNWGRPTAWDFEMAFGAQNVHYQVSGGYGLAVHVGQVSSVPVPATVWLFVSGLTGLAVLGKRRTKNCV